MFKYRLYQRSRKVRGKVRTSPLWWVAIGREIEEPTGTADPVQAKAFAETLAERLWREKKLGDHTAVSFADTAHRWLKCDAREKKVDREFLKWLLPRIGNESLSSVAHEKALEALRDQGEAQGWGRNSIDRMMTTVSSVLNFPRRRKGLKDEDGAAGQMLLPRISVPKYGEKLREPRYLTPAQYERVMAELPEHQRLFQQLGTATLLRMRSMLKMTWARVDLKRRKAWIPAAEMKQEDTFNFPLSKAACDILERIQLLQEEEYARHVADCQRKGKTPRPYPEHVCTYRSRPLDDLTTAAFKAACERAGVPWCTTHIMSRHTGASWGAQAGVTLEERMQQGGWKDERSARRYSHLDDSQIHRAANVVGQMLVKAVNVKSAKRAKKPTKSSHKDWSHGDLNPGPLPCHGNRK